MVSSHQRLVTYYFFFSTPVFKHLVFNQTALHFTQKNGRFFQNIQPDNNFFLNLKKNGDFRIVSRRDFSAAQLRCGAVRAAMD